MEGNFSFFVNVVIEFSDTILSVTILLGLIAQTLTLCL